MGKRRHENWARALLRILECEHPPVHAERTLAAGGLHIDELVDFTSKRPPTALGPLGEYLDGHLVAFEFFSRRLRVDDLLHGLAKLCLLATVSQRRAARTALVVIGVKRARATRAVLAESFVCTPWSSGAWAFEALFGPVQFWVVDTEALPKHEEGTSVWRLFTRVDKLGDGRVGDLLHDPAVEGRAEELEDAIMTEALKQGHEDVVWRGTAQLLAEGRAKGLAEGRAEGLAEGRRALLEVARAALPPGEVESLAKIDDLDALRDALAEALRRLRAS